MGRPFPGDPVAQPTPTDPSSSPSPSTSTFPLSSARAQPTLPTASSFASALFDLSQPTPAMNDWVVPEEPSLSLSSSSPSRSLAGNSTSRVSSNTSALTSASGRSRPTPRFDALETTPLRPLHLDARPLRVSGGAGASEVRASRVGTSSPPRTRLRRESLPSPVTRSIVEGVISLSSSSPIRRAPTPGIPGRDRDPTSVERMFNLADHSTLASTTFESSELLTSTIAPWRELSAFRASVNIAREAVEPLNSIGEARLSPVSPLGTMTTGGANGADAGITTASRLMDTQRVLRGAQQALRTAVAFAERLEQVTSSLSSTSSQLGSTPAAPAPTPRPTPSYTPLFERGHSSTPSGTTTTAMMPPLAIASLQRSIIQLRAASLRIDTLLEEFPSLVGPSTATSDDPIEISPEEHRARFYSFPSMADPTVSLTEPETVESRLELARTRLRNAQQTLDMMSRVREGQEARQRAVTVGPTHWEELRRVRPEWDFLRPPTSTATSSSRTTVEPEPESEPEPLRETTPPGQYPGWRRTSRVQVNGRMMRAFPIKLDRNGVEIEEEESSEQEIEGAEGLAKVDSSSGSGSGRTLKNKSSRELCGR